jgi:hypothetical protein
MPFSADEKLLALATAYRALVVSLIDEKTLDPERFERHAVLAIERLHAVGQIQASSAAAEMLEPLLSDIRRVIQRRGGK